MKRKKGAPEQVQGYKPPTGAALAKQEATVQAASMLARRVLGSETHSEISRIFGCSPATVAKRLELARAADLTQLAKDIICERMFPKALTILDQRLDAGDYEAAKDVLYGLQILTKGGTMKMEHITSTTPTLDQIRKEQLKTVEAQILSSPDDTNNAEG